MNLNCEHVLSDVIVTKRESTGGIGNSSYVPIGKVLNERINYHISPFPDVYDHQTDHILKPIMENIFTITNLPANTIDVLSSVQGEPFVFEELERPNENSITYKATSNSSHIPMSTTLIPYIVKDELKERLHHSIDIEQDIDQIQDITNYQLVFSLIDDNGVKTQIDPTTHRFYEDWRYLMEISIFVDHHCDNRSLQFVLESNSPSVMSFLSNSETESSKVDMEIAAGQNMVTLQVTLKTHSMSDGNSPPLFPCDFEARTVEHPRNCSIMLQRFTRLLTVHQKPNITNIETFTLNTASDVEQIFTTVGNTVRTTMHSSGVIDDEQSPVVYAVQKSSTSGDIISRELVPGSVVETTINSDVIYVWTFDYVISNSSTSYVLDIEVEEHEKYNLISV